MDQTNLNFTTQAYHLVEKLAVALEAIAKALQEYNERQAGVVLDDDEAAVALDVVDWTIEEAQAAGTVRRRSTTWTNFGIPWLPTTNPGRGPYIRSFEARTFLCDSR